MVASVLIASVTIPSAHADGPDRRSMLRAPQTTLKTASTDTGNRRLDALQAAANKASTR